MVALSGEADADMLAADRRRCSVAAGRDDKWDESVANRVAALSAGCINSCRSVEWLRYDSSSRSRGSTIEAASRRRMVSSSVQQLPAAREWLV